MEKNQAGKWIVFAFDVTDNTAVTGDAANITANVRIDGGAANAVDDTNPTELEDGYYIFDITAAEANGDLIVICPASGTANVQVIGVPGAVYTTPANFNATVISAGGVVNSAVQSIAAAAITAASIASSALTSAKFGAGAITSTVLADNAITAAKINSAALTAAKFGTDFLTSTGLAASAATEIATSVWASVTRTLTAATNFNNLSQADVRSAVGLASADLDTQIGTLATSASVAALNDLSAADVNAQVDSALLDYDGPTNAELSAGFAALNDLSAAQVNAEVDTALSDIHLDHLFATNYDPAAKPGSATALLNELVEDDGGVARYTVNALENGPSGSGASAASIADAVWTEALADHSGTAGSTAEALDNATAPTASAVADAVWDEVITGAEHNVNNSAAKFLREASEAITGVTGTAQGAGTGNNQIQLASGAVSVDNLYNGERIAIIEGTGAGQSRLIEDSTASTDTLTLYTDWVINPSTDSVYAIVGAEVDVVAIGAFDATASSAVNFDDIAEILLDTDELQTNQGNWLTATGFATASALATVDTVVDGIQTDLSNGTDGLGAIKTAVDAIPATAAPTAIENADALLNRDMSAVTVTNNRSPINALRFLRNKYEVVGTTLTVYEEDDTTSAWTAALTANASADPITASDPA